MVSEGFAEDDIIEHLDDTDATAVCLVNEEPEHLLVLLHRLVIHLWRKGVVFEFHQGGKGMTVPEIDRVHIVLCE